MYKEIKKSKNPRYLVITPLKVGDKISKETKTTVRRNNLQFDWISFEADNNIPTNTELALKEYEKKHGWVDYIIKIDNDIKMSKGLLDKMYYYLSKSNDNIAYIYCRFAYLLPNKRKLEFYRDFELNILLIQNYISSNSMIKRDKLHLVGGFVTDGKYERLLDWCLWLRFAYYDYCGELLPHDKFFTTPLNENNVSARGAEDYTLKSQRVFDDFIMPIINKFNIR